MIEWIEYDRNDRTIESHRNHLITDGWNVKISQHAKLINSDGYGWHKENNEPLNFPVTHWARIVLPSDTW